jgi:hypothetical protein
MQKITGLPESIFAYQKAQFWYLFEHLGMEYFGKFYGG